MSVDSPAMLKLLQLSLWKPSVVIILLVLFKGYIAEETYRTPSAPPYLATVLLVQLILVLLTAFFALRDNRLALFIMVVFLWVQVLGCVFTVLRPSSHHYIMKSFGLIAGAYFSTGAVALWRYAKAHGIRETPNQAL